MADRSSGSTTRSAPWTACGSTPAKGLTDDDFTTLADWLRPLIRK
jgi:hypothetical protein